MCRLEGIELKLEEWLVLLFWLFVRWINVFGDLEPILAVPNCGISRASSC